MCVIWLRYSTTGLRTRSLKHFDYVTSNAHVLGELTVVSTRFITSKKECDHQKLNMCSCNTSTTSHLDPILLKRKSNLKRHLSYFLWSKPSFLSKIVQSCGKKTRGINLRFHQLLLCCLSGSTGSKCYFRITINSFPNLRENQDKMVLFDISRRLPDTGKK